MIIILLDNKNRPQKNFQTRVFPPIPMWDVFLLIFALLVFVFVFVFLFFSSLHYWWGGRKWGSLYCSSTGPIIAIYIYIAI